MRIFNNQSLFLQAQLLWVCFKMPIVFSAFNPCNQFPKLHSTLFNSSLLFGYANICATSFPLGLNLEISMFSFLFLWFLGSTYGQSLLTECRVHYANQRIIALKRQKQHF